VLDLYQPTIKLALQVVMGAGNLAAVLRVPQVNIERWMRGDGTPDLEMFRRILDIVVRHGPR
jgi:hypothetical protein